MPAETRNSAATIADSFMKPPSGVGGSRSVAAMGPTNKGCRLFRTLVAAPAGVERKVEPPARAAKRRGIGFKLGGVAAAFLIEERLDRGAFVPAGLEVDHPEPPVRVAEYAIHYVGTPATGRVDPHAVFAARESMRAEDPAPAFIGERVSQREGDRLRGALELRWRDPPALKISRKRALKR